MSCSRKVIIDILWRLSVTNKKQREVNIIFLLISMLESNAPYSNLFEFNRTGRKCGLHMYYQQHGFNAQALTNWVRDYVT